MIEAREVTMRVALTFDAAHSDRDHRIGAHDEILAVLAGRAVSIDVVGLPPSRWIVSA